MDFSGKVNGPIIVVFKIEMHCEGCAEKVRRSVKGLKGVEATASDILESKLTVIGKVNPLELRGHVESRTHKKVELIYPVIAIKKEESSKAEGNADAKAKKPDNDKDQKIHVVNKPNEPPSTTSVVLKIELHCMGCTQRIKKEIYKYKGVHSVLVDRQRDLVTVNGTMDVNNLACFLTAKLKKGVQVVNLKKNEDDDKKKKDNGNSGKKELKVTPVESLDAAAITALINTKMDYYPYHFETVQRPQLFSDENPNACSIM